MATITPNAPNEPQATTINYEAPIDPGAGVAATAATAATAAASLLALLVGSERLRVLVERPLILRPVLFRKRTEFASSGILRTRSLMLSAKRLLISKRLLLNMTELLIAFVVSIRLQRLRRKRSVCVLFLQTLRRSTRLALRQSLLSTPKRFRRLAKRLQTTVPALKAEPLTLRARFLALRSRE